MKFGFGFIIIDGTPDLLKIYRIGKIMHAVTSIHQNEDLLSIEYTCYNLAKCICHSRSSRQSITTLDTTDVDVLVVVVSRGVVGMLKVVVSGDVCLVYKAMKCRFEILLTDLFRS